MQEPEFSPHEKMLFGDESVNMYATWSFVLSRRGSWLIESHSVSRLLAPLQGDRLSSSRLPQSIEALGFEILLVRLPRSPFRRSNSLQETGGPTGYDTHLSDMRLARLS